jgi:hypothetical protein
MTFVQPENGRALAYHVSWHKPASPLHDALESLHGVPRRASWLSATLRLHIWDRGGSGRPTLRWALARRIPYLTVTQGATRWTRYRRAPRVHTRSNIPVFVRRDAAVARGRPKGTMPQEVIFPAHPDKGRSSAKALRYRTNATLPEAELQELDLRYKTRWPCNENTIKALIAVGFDRNLDRGLTPTSSRGTDGRLLRLEAREQALHDKIEAFNPSTVPQVIQQGGRLFREKATCERQRAEISALPKDKGARMPTGAELLCKNLMLLMYNALALLLLRSPLEEVRAMTPARVHELLLGRSLRACLDTQVTTVWIEPVPSSPERALQEELVRLLNERSLALRGRRLRVRLRDPPEQPRPLRVSG